MERTGIMDDSPLAKELFANPKLTLFSRDELLPLYNHREFRKAQGRKGQGYISEFPKHGHLQFWEEETKKMHCAVYFSPLTEGPPGCAHGGSIAASFDHLFGNYLMRACGVQYHTVNLTIDYKLFIKLDSIVKAVLEIEKIDGRKVFVKGTMTNDEGKVHAVSTAIFLRNKDISMDFDTFLRVAQRKEREFLESKSKL